MEEAGYKRINKNFSMDTRGLQINRDIYNFETRIYKLYDSLPHKHRHTLSELMLRSVLETRHYTNIACRMYKGNVKAKAEMFGLALGYANDAQDSLDHLYDMGFLSDKQKASLDMDLDVIVTSLSRLVNSFNRQVKGAERSEYANCGDPLNQEGR